MGWTFPQTQIGLKAQRRTHLQTSPAISVDLGESCPQGPQYLGFLILLGLTTLPQPGRYLVAFREPCGLPGQPQPLSVSASGPVLPPPCGAPGTVQRASWEALLAPALFPGPGNDGVDALCLSTARPSWETPGGGTGLASEEEPCLRAPGLHVSLSGPALRLSGTAEGSLSLTRPCRPHVCRSL